MIAITFGKVKVELAETITFKSQGLEHVLALREFSEAGIRKYIFHAKRYLTDGAPLIDEDDVEGSTEKRRLAVQAKIDGLYGLRPISEGRGDAVASRLKFYLRRYFRKQLGWTPKQCQVKLGVDVAGVTAFAKAAGVKADWLKRATATAKADVERERNAAEGLGI